MALERFLLKIFKLDSLLQNTLDLDARYEFDDHKVYDKYEVFTRPTSTDQNY